ncbi:hypothetical protein WDJ51_06980 [Rathayibacter sp. YIM 133350]|uniref:hypothetical protein n=1 Tax=Rathayibacter sp. YIM 133350 TaxID=3131992 RepID=UPI00307E939E
MNRLRSASLRLRGDEGGVALVAVIGLSMIMLILVTTAVSFSISGYKKARTDQNWDAALAAAYAGADEYGSRLSNDSTYQKYGNPLAPFTVAMGSASTVSLPTGANANPAFGLGTGPNTWADIAGSANRASFRYEVDNSRYSSTGVIRIRSTGRVGQTTRSVIVDLKQKGFIDFLYYTDLEVMDPQISSMNCINASTGKVDYAVMNGTTDTKHDTDCQEINFAAADTFYGPVQSNDTLRICGAHFTGQVKSAGVLPFVKPSGCADGVYDMGAPTASAPYDFPPTNQQMSREARIDLPEVPRPGCMYTGPTTITLTGDGKMNVVSPWTKFTQPSYTAGINSAKPDSCGKISDLQSTAGATINVPDQNLIWVQNVPTSSTDPNYTSSSSTPSNFSCTGSGATSGWTFTSSTTTIQYPATNEVIPPTSSSTVPAYACRNGDVFVKGTLKGALTIAAQNFVYVTGDIVYKDQAVDVLGLVGQNAVWVWNPMKSSTNCTTNSGSRATSCAPLLTDTSRTIQAAILSVAHTFQVQNYEAAPQRGYLRVLGAISQKYRGTVSKGSTVVGGVAGVSDGYVKDYHYDTRLRTTAPPKFLTPTSTTYGVTRYTDVAAAFKASGANGP